MNNIDFFQQNKYCLVENAINNEVCSLATVYALFDEKQNFLSEDMQGFHQVPNAHTKYADPLMESLLLHLLPIIENNTGLSLFPTYSFYRVYRDGDELKPHIDRESCEISATLCLGYNYDDSEGSWPIYIENDAYHMEPGDLIIYRGTELNHYRKPFNADKDSFHVQVFLHYVDKNGPYKEFKFDKRKDIGEKRNKKDVAQNTFSFNKHATVV